MVTVSTTKDVLAVCINCITSVKITDANVDSDLEEQHVSQPVGSTVCVLVYTKCRTCADNHQTYVSTYNTINDAYVPGEAVNGEVWKMHMSSIMSRSLHGYTIASKLGYTTVLETEFEFMNRNLIRCMSSIASKFFSIVTLESKGTVYDVRELGHLRGSFF